MAWETGPAPGVSSRGTPARANLLPTFLASLRPYPLDFWRTPTASPQNLVPPFPIPAQSLQAGWCAESSVSDNFKRSPGVSCKLVPSSRCVCVQYLAHPFPLKESERAPGISSFHQARARSRALGTGSTCARVQPRPASSGGRVNANSPPFSPVSVRSHLSHGELQLQGKGSLTKLCKERR